MYFKVYSFVMSQESIVVLTGILILLSPFLGIPTDWKEWGHILLGAVMMIIGYRLRRARYLRSLETKEGERRAEAFVENQAPIVGSRSRDA